MTIFIAIILALIFFGVIACVERVGEIEDLLRDEKKPFLREDSHDYLGMINEVHRLNHEAWTDDMWDEVKPKKGKKL